MLTVRCSHRLACVADEFWRVFFDPDYNRRLFREILFYPAYEVLEQHETDLEIRRKVAAEPHVVIPGPLRKLVAGGLRYVEDGTFDKRERTWHWTLASGSFAARVHYAGTIEARPAVNGSCERLAEATITARAPAFTGLFERIARDRFHEVMEASARYVEQWLATR